MKSSELRQLIRECIDEIILEAEDADTRHVRSELEKNKILRGNRKAIDFNVSAWKFLTTAGYNQSKISGEIKNERAEVGQIDGLIKQFGFKKAINVFVDDFGIKDAVIRKLGGPKPSEFS